MKKEEWLRRASTGVSLLSLFTIPLSSVQRGGNRTLSYINAHFRLKFEDILVRKYHIISTRHHTYHLSSPLKKYRTHICRRKEERNCKVTVVLNLGKPIANFSHDSWDDFRDKKWRAFDLTSIRLRKKETFLFIPWRLILHLTTNGKALQSATLYCLGVN